jgi:hypothetical protein
LDTAGSGDGQEKSKTRMHPMTLRHTNHLMIVRCRPSRTRTDSFDDAADSKNNDWRYRTRVLQLHPPPRFVTSETKSWLR